MSPTPRSRLVSLAAAALLAASALLAAGCAAGATTSNPAPTPVVLATLDPALIPSRAPLPSRAPTPTPKPTPKPTPTPAPTAAPKTAIEKLKIGSPYRLVDNPANQALHANINLQMGSVTVTEKMTGREIYQGTTPVGLAYVLEITGVPMTEAVFEGGARGAAANTGGKLTYATVLGHKVAYVSAPTAGFALFLHDNNIVMVGAQTLPLTKTLLTALLKANA